MDKVDPEILSNTAEALMAGNVSAAILACKSEGETEENNSRWARIVELVLTRTPQALADCPPDYLPPLRVAAALMGLFGLGVSSIRKFIAVEDDYNYRRSPTAVAVMLFFHAQHLYDLSQKADAHITMIEVLSAGNPDDCAVCSAANGKRFHLTEAPELPHPDCTCSDWCKCILVAVES